MKYVVIVGGQLHNKGAQAMTFTAVEAVQRKYPNKKVVLFASVYSDRDKKEKDHLCFEVYPWTLRVKMDFVEFKYKKYVGLKEIAKAKIRGSGISNEQKDNIKTILRNTDLMIDVSGFALSSQRGFIASLNYLFNIIIAKKFDIPMVMFPQSFGPFDYEKKHSRILISLMEEFLRYPQKIYVREKVGLNYLEQLFKLKNVEHRLDCVLGREAFVASNLYRTPQNYQLNLKIIPNSIAIVPNEKIMIHGNPSKQYKLYKKIIDLLLEKGKKVYLIRHSYEDINICRNIKDYYSNVDDVILIEDDMNCIQMNELIKKFDFLIASRYHSIIHAYNNGIPTFVFGWAVKYKEIMEYFSQDKYLFDVRNEYNDDDIISKLDHLLTNYEEESRIIMDKIKGITQNDLI